MAIAHYVALTNLTRNTGYLAQPHIVSPSFDHFLGANDLQNSMMSRVLYGFYMNLSLNAAGVITVIPTPAAGAFHARNAVDPAACWFPNAVGGPAYAAIAVDTAAVLLNGDITGLQMREIHHTIANGSNWLIELSCAQMYGDLSPENLISYFSMVKVRISNPRPLLNFLDWSSRVLVVTLMDNAIRNITLGTVWGQYRLTASSVVSLFDMMRADYGAITDDIIGAANVILIGNLRAAQWDIALHRLIPSITLAKIYGALDASGGVPRNWYSGIRAYNTVNNATKNAWMAGFRRLLEVHNNVVGLAAMNNGGNIIDAVGLRQV